jgi:hypothetical protein
LLVTEISSDLNNTEAWVPPCFIPGKANSLSRLLDLQIAHFAPLRVVHLTYDLSAEERDDGPHLFVLALLFYGSSTI